MMKTPPHPGQSVRHDCLEPLGLSVTEGAKALGVSRQALNNLVNGKSGISPEMAIRLSKAFGGTPEVWLRLQMAYDLSQARQHEDEIIVARVAAPAENGMHV
ncbi:MAG: HigA family addiction module antitoxin [Acidobacteriota bacterium]